MNRLGNDHDDSFLIQATLDGKHEAFGHLVERYQDRLYGSLIHVLGCEAEALDIAQDAFVQAFRRLDSFRGQSAFYTWLFRIGRNLAISRLRRRKPTASLHNHDGEAIDIADQSTAPAGGIESEETIGQLHIALQRLSEEHRTIIVLRELNEMDYDAIADVLEIPVGTVRSRLHRARQQLKQELEAIGATPN
ncbi:MAG: sigma-70 family RNA polymerase sigma factor [Pirellulaceae bacterium]